MRVRLSFRAQANETWIYSVFFAASAHRVGSNAVADAKQIVSADGPSVKLRPWRGRFHSGEHARLFRWRVETGRVRSAYVAFTVCASGLPAT